MKGKGIKPQVEYKWSKQPNGLFTIFDVPIFSEYKGDDERPSFSKEGLVELVMGFEKWKEVGFFPRIFVGHHDDGVKNQRSVGFLDNLTERGGTIFADLVEIPWKIIQEIKKNKYPYRSVELDLDEFLIEGLALLESRPPYFKYPILFLEEGSVDLSKFGKRVFKKRKMLFSRGRKNMSWFRAQYQEKEEPGVKGPDKEERDVKDVMEVFEEKMDECFKKYMEEDMPAKIEEVFSRYMDETLDEKIEGYVKKYMDEEKEKENEEKFEDGDGEKKAKREGGISSSSLAMQKQMIEIFNKLSSQIEEIKEGKNTDSMIEELRSLSYQNPSIDFQSEKEILSQFPNKKSKEIYMRKLRNQSKFGNHSSSGLASEMGFRPNEKILEKYQGDHKKIARELSRSWRDTKKERGAKFTKVWPSEEKFVDFFMENEMENAGYIKKNLGISV